MPWANGELPEQVKNAGGARWAWQPSADEPREIICLAREGAKLFIDGTLVIECPLGLPYVPATHRSAAGTRVRVSPSTGPHEARLELGCSNSEQEASVILAYPNLHIAPWTESELPQQAILPTV